MMSKMIDRLGGVCNYRILRPLSVIPEASGGIYSSEL